MHVMHSVRVASPRRYIEVEIFGLEAGRDVL